MNFEYREKYYDTNIRFYNRFFGLVLVCYEFKMIRKYDDDGCNLKLNSTKYKLP